MSKEALKALKAGLRKEIKQRIRSLSQHEIERQSLSVCNRVKASNEFAACKAVACYDALKTEVDTKPIIAEAFAQGKTVFLPIVIDGV
jgi:5,10-methenyltetrahydrofolate synthetase